MTATGPQWAGSRRVATVLGAVVVAVVGLTAWLIVAVVGTVDRAADRRPAEMMLRAVPATYQPAPQAAAVAQRPRSGSATGRRGAGW